MNLKCLGLAAALTLAGLLPATAQSRNPMAVIADPMDFAQRIASLIDQDDFGSASRDILTSLRSNVDRSEFARQLGVMQERGSVGHRATASDRTAAGVARTICLYRVRESAERIGFFFYIYVFRMSEAGWRLSNFKFNEIGNEHLPPGC